MLGLILDVIETGMQIGVACELSALEKERKRLEAERDRILAELAKIEASKEDDRWGQASR